MKKIIVFSVMAVFGMASVFGGNGKKAAAVAHDDVVNVVSTVHEDATAIYNDGKSVVTTLYGDGKELLKDVYPEVKAAVESIAHAIGVAAEHVYVVLVKKFFVDGITSLLITLVAITLIILGAIKLRKYVNKTKEAIDWHVLYPLLYLIPGIIIAFNVDYHTMLLNLINPEWGAINYIMEMTQNLIKG